MMSNDEVRYYNLAAAGGRSAAHAAAMMMARHLRIDHGWSLHRIQRALGVSRTELKRLLGEV